MHHVLFLPHYDLITPLQRAFAVAYRLITARPRRV